MRTLAQAAVLAALALPLASAARAQPRIVVEDTQVRENGGEPSFVIRLTEDAREPVSVDFVARATGSAVEGPCAVGGSDFEAQSGTARFRRGDREAQFLLRLCDDLVDEEDETYRIVLRNPVGAAIDRARAQVLILDDDDGAGPPRLPAAPHAADLSIENTRLREGDAGEQLVEIPVTLSAPAAVPVLFDVVHEGGAATRGANCSAGVDYSAPRSESLRIEAGSTVVRARVRICGDTTPEDNELATIRLTNAVGARIFDDVAALGIEDDDREPPAPLPPLDLRGPVAVEVADVTIAEGDDGRTRARFTGTLSQPLPAELVLDPVAVPLRSLTPNSSPPIAGDSCRGDTDFLTRVARVRVPAGRVSFSFDVVVCGDRRQEANERLGVTIPGVPGRDVTDARASLTIEDDD